MTPALMLMLAALAAGEPCSDDASRMGPAPLTAQADFGEPVAPCAQSELALRLDGGLVIDNPGFYGRVTALGTVDGRWQLDGRWSLIAAAALVTWRYAVNAVVESTALSVGPLTLGAARSFTLGETALTGSLRLLVPADSARRTSLLTGLEAGLSGQQEAISLPATLAVGDGQGAARLFPSVLGEVVFAPATWVAVAVGVRGWFEAAPSPAFLELAPRLTVAFQRGRWRFALVAQTPVAGADRSDTSAALLVGLTGP